MHRLTYTITANELVNPHTTADYNDVLEAKAKLTGVKVVENYERIPEDRGKPSAKRQAILDKYGYVKPVKTA